MSSVFKLLIATSFLTLLTLSRSANGLRRHKRLQYPVTTTDQLFTVWIGDADDPIQCAGVFIRKDLVVTAAPCIKRLYNSPIILTFNDNGDMEQVTVTGAKIYIHHRHERKPGMDIGVLRLPNAIARKYGKRLIHIEALASKEYENKISYPNQGLSTCHLFGWRFSNKKITTNKDLSIDVYLMPKGTCSGPLGTVVKDTQLCTYEVSGYDKCPSISGMPLVCRINNRDITLVGVYAYPDHNNCGDSYHVTSRVSEKRQWLNKVLDGSALSLDEMMAETTTMPTSTEPAPRTCNPSTEFTCSDLSCIPRSSVCDGFKDCIKLEDEEACGCSSMGTEFITGFMNNAGPEATILYITAPNNTNVTVTIPAFSLVRTYEVQGSLKLSYNDSLIVAEETSNKGVHIASDTPISVVSVSSRDLSYSSVDGTLVYPINCLSDYYIADSINHDVKVSSQLMIIGASQFTTTANLTYRNGFVRTVTIPYLNTYYIQNKDVRRVAITANQNVVVMSGSECGYVPSALTSSCDHMVNQMPPVSSLGKAYIAASMNPRLGFSIRIIAPSENTNVTMTYANGSNIVTTTLAAANSEYFTSFYNGETISVVSNNSVMVTQFSHDRSIDNVTNGDPSMVTLPDLSQMDTRYDFVIPDHYVRVGLYVYFSTWYSESGLRLDGESVTDYVRNIVHIPEYGSFNVFHIMLNNSWLENRYSTLSHTDSRAHMGVILYGQRGEGQFAWRIGGML